MILVAPSWLLVLLALGNYYVVLSDKNCPMSFQHGNVPIGRRVFSGSPAPEGKFPFMVLVMSEKPDGRWARCSAALLTPDWILLAAHCVDTPGQDPTMILGASGKADFSKYLRARRSTPFNKDLEAERFGVEERRGMRFVIHPEYDRSILANDLALIRVNAPFSDKIKILPLGKTQNETLSNCVILGWGVSEVTKEFDGILRYADQLNAKSPYEGCHCRIKGNIYCIDHPMKAIGEGDSGSPLVCDNQIWGVASYTTKCNYSECPNPQGCNESFYAAAFTYLNWINSNSGGSDFSISMIFLLGVITICLLY